MKTPCAQCAGGGNCAQAGANFECERSDDGSWCETIVLAGGGFIPDCGGGQFAMEVRKQAKETNAEFKMMFRVERVNYRLALAGVEVGDLVTHINRHYPTDIFAFHRLMEEAKENCELHVMKPDGKRIFVKV